ncbi:hypothetical protein A2U01_0082320, partial [Trifolium medium]|nr:hypothetical protein [Trifolium medium]
MAIVFFTCSCARKKKLE